MQVTLKLFASLSQYLPPGSVEQQTIVEMADGGTAAGLVEQMALPEEYCFLVLRNGVFLTPEEREVEILADGDTIAIWPPVAGG